ncbi:unnamed protein product [Adineta ricciae]|uniref:Uncharacterized protein n=1 Tax=Adineta ricciae TaxID=249248 RepID=A0A814SMU4_ADIRI|nr:unnamed protein product [Adineta ricciae]
MDNFLREILLDNMTIDNLQLLKNKVKSSSESLKQRDQLAITQFFSIPAQFSPIPASSLPPDSGRNCTGSILSVPDRFQLEVCRNRSGNDWNLCLNFRRQGNGRKTNLTGRNRPCHNNLGIDLLLNYMYRYDNFDREILQATCSSSEEYIDSQSSNIIECDHCENEMENLKEIICDKLKLTTDTYAGNQYVVIEGGLHTTTNKRVYCYEISQLPINSYFLEPEYQIFVVSPNVIVKSPEGYFLGYSRIFYFDLSFFIPEKTSVHFDENFDQPGGQLALETIQQI